MKYISMRFSGSEGNGTSQGVSTTAQNAYSPIACISTSGDSVLLVLYFNNFQQYIS
jgi:hypothetical protein